MSTSKLTHTDPITKEIIHNALVATAQEMNNIIVRTAFNPLLFDTRDFGIAILSAEGHLWADDPGLVAFITNMETLIRSGLDRVGAENYEEGDVYIANDPYLTGTHISDTSIYAPIIRDGRLLAFAAITAHWADIGGRTPGGWDMTAQELYQEGLCFTHQRLYSRGTPVQDMLDFISSNVRFPDIVAGDIEAQLAACRVGTERFLTLCEKYGEEVVIESMNTVVAETAALTARRISSLPDGRFSERIIMDYDGLDRNVRPEVQVNLTVDEERIRVDFEGTSQVAQTSMNITRDGAVACVSAALKGLMAPNEPTNHGHFANIDFDFKDGTLVSPVRPQPSDAYGMVGMVLVELAQVALAPLFPDTSRAGSYQIFGIYLLRTDPKHGEPFIMIDPIDGGHGAHRDGDGSTVVFTLDGDTWNLPAEVLENRYPLRLLQFDFAPDSPGSGQHVGGRGVVRDYEILEDGTILKYLNENTINVLSRGIEGGSDGQPNMIVLNPSTPNERILPGRSNDAGVLFPGDVVRVISGGGGGWGTAD